MRHLKALLSGGLVVSACLANVYSDPAQAAPDERPTVVVNYGGSTYSITSQFVNYTNSSSLLESQPWWGNTSLSNGLAGLVGTSAGFYQSSGSLGILFAYGVSGSNVSIDYFDGSNTINCPTSCPGLSSNFYYAIISQLVTLQTMAASLESTSSGVNALNSNLSMMINGAHSRPLARLVDPGKSTFWAAGDWGRDDHGNRSGNSGLAEIGFGHNLGFAQINLSLGQTYAKQDLINDGEVKSDGRYLMLEGIIPLTQVEGLYATLGAYGHWGEADIRRGYFNMSTLESSNASPDTETWGMRARLDWQNALSVANTGVSPYVDLSYSSSHMESYTEEGGGLPARFDGRTDDRTEARLGINTQTPLPFISGYNFVTNLEAAHRFDKNSAGVNGAVDGFFTFNLPGEDVTNDWLKAGAGVEGEAGPGKLSVMLNGTTQSEMPNFWVATSYQLQF